MHYAGSFSVGLGLCRL